MADINASVPVAATEARHRAEPVWDLIELLFFAYRDFFGDADAVLAKFGFGRAHHRVLHFVNRNPGMKVVPHLLVADDDRRIRDLLSRYLRAEGYRVTTADTAADARAKLDGLSFDLLILDVTMPGETGFEFAKSL